jgi:dipeptide/tripeptide permease
VFGDNAQNWVATINDDERANIAESIGVMVAAHSAGDLSEETLEEGTHELLASKVRLQPSRVRELLDQGDGDVAAITDTAIDEGRQFNPEFIVNINAGSIILFQMLISFLMGRFHRFTTMIAGMIVAGIGIGLSAFANAHGMLGVGGSIWIVCLGLLTFSFGEMMASPTSQEYVGRIAPRDKVALYMGYYFVAIALGNLFGGILSGQMYAKYAQDMEQPEIMWAIFGVLMFVTAFVFLLYNKFALPKEKAGSLTEG